MSSHTHTQYRTIKTNIDPDRPGIELSLASCLYGTQTVLLRLSLIWIGTRLSAIDAYSRLSYPRTLTILSRARSR